MEKREPDKIPNGQEDKKKADRQKKEKNQTYDMENPSVSCKPSVFAVLRPRLADYKWLVLYFIRNRHLF